MADKTVMTIQPNPAIMDRALDMSGGCDPCQAGCNNITLRGHAAICCICRGVDEDYCGPCERRHEERGTRCVYGYFYPMGDI